MQYLLDTNIVSDLMRHPRGRCRLRLDETGSENVCTSVIVVAEVRFGLARIRSRKLEAQLDAILSVLEVLPLETPFDHTYASLRSRLETQGTPIGALDTLIAAHAMALGATLVTDNVAEFSRIEGLAVENWLRSSDKPGAGG